MKDAPTAAVFTWDADRPAYDNPELAFCLEPACRGYSEGFLFYEETELCPFCGSERWS